MLGEALTIHSSGRGFKDQISYIHAEDMLLGTNMTVFPWQKIPVVAIVNKDYIMMPCNT
jgi:hypothetical protein